MGWPVVALVLVTCAVLGAVAGSLRERRHRVTVLVLTGLVALAAFAPGACVQGTADGAGVPIGSTSCDTLYGARLPGAGPVPDVLAGWLLACAGTALAVLSAVVTRRSRRSLDA